MRLPRIPAMILWICGLMVVGCSPDGERIQWGDQVPWRSAQLSPLW
jgi:hypothetical protein